MPARPVLSADAEHRKLSGREFARVRTLARFGRTQTEIAPPARCEPADDLPGAF